jgi:hypothetical protein
MDGITPEPEDDGDAVRAFEALRAEVAALRQGVELVYRQGEQAGSGAPDYRAGRPARVKTHGKEREHGQNSCEFERWGLDLVRLRYGLVVYCVQSWRASGPARRIGY